MRCLWFKHKKGSLPESEKTKYEIHEYYTSKYDIADDVLPFFPHIVLKDLVAFCVFLALFTYVLFFAPEMGGKFLEHPNFEIANPLLFALPWVDRGRVKSWRYRCGLHKVNLIVFAIVFVFLGYLGGTPQENWKIIASQIATVMYFGFFIALFLYSKNENTKPVPERISK